jgi:DNA polymerase-3 subunit alpha
LVLNEEPEESQESLEADELSPETEIPVADEVEETRIITRLSMPSRKLKIRISGNCSPN